MADEQSALEEGIRPSRGRYLARAVGILVFTLIAAGLLSVDAVFGALQQLLHAAEPVIAARPIVGAVVFVLLAATSALLAFFSSAVIVPAAVVSWGPLATMLLLWLGWMLGGVFAFALGHSFRRPEGQPSRLPPAIAAHLARVPSDIGFPLLLLWQLVLPSEVPGYLCGYLGVRFRTYLAAAAVAELPYAAGAVLLGETVVNRQTGGLLLLGVVAAALGYLLVRRLRLAEGKQ